MNRHLRRLALCAAALLSLPAAAYAGSPSVKIDSGDTAWMMLSTALVFLMTPGLALFYGGMVRGKNVLSVLMQSFVAAGLVSVLWIVVGYSLAFGPDHGGVIGDFSWAGLNGVSIYRGDGHYVQTVPHMLFMLFQMTFAIITPALISGAVVERMKFSAYFLFLILWSLLVYAPLAHMVWGYGGLLGMTGRVKALDFAGGTVVETASGIAALVMALMLGPRRSQSGDELRPHNLSLTLLGTGILWFGWFGFNAGSALTSGSLAVSAFIATQAAGAAAALAWLLIEWALYKKPSALGFATGAIAGMVAITPAAGFVRPMPALFIGAVAAVVSFYAIRFKSRAGYDDSLDVFGVHGCAGIWGMLATGLFATVSVNSSGADGLFNGNPTQFGRQALAVLLTIVFVAAGTFLIAKVVSVVTGGLRASAEDEENGLDVTEHGEVAYSGENAGAPAFAGLD
jgi:Amt family ammonium transporter